jgi:hypothetical protein
MKRFVDPATQEAFCATLVKGPGMGFTLSLHTSSTNGMPRVSRHLFVPPAKAAEGLRAYNRPHRPEMLIRFAEGLLPLPTPVARPDLVVIDEASDVTEEVYEYESEAALMRHLAFARSVRP